VRELARASKSVDPDRATLNLRHDPRNEANAHQWDGLVQKHEVKGYGFVGLVRRRMNLHGDKVRHDHERPEDRSKEQDAPTGAKSFVTEEDVAQR